MDASEFTNSEDLCPLCGGQPGNPECHCIADPETGACEHCDAGGECPCPPPEEQLKLAADIRKAAFDTPFKLGL